MVSPGALWTYYWARLRTHPVQELLALVGIATGVALIFAVMVANTSVTGSLERLTAAVAGDASMQIAARDSRGIDENVLDAIRRVPGVRTAAPLLEQRAELKGPDGARSANVVGVTPDLAALDGPLPRSLGEGGVTLNDSLVLPARIAEAIGIEPGERAVLEVRGRSVSVRISVKLGHEQLGEFVESPLVVTPLWYLQRIAGLARRVTRVFVATAPGSEAAVRAALQARFGDRLNVGDIYTEARLLRQAAGPLEQSTGLFAAIAGLVGLLFAFNAMLLTIPERRRFIAELRLQGFGDGQVALHVAFEALILGAAASAVGLVFGDQLSRHLFEPQPAYLAFAFPVGDQRIVTTETILLACAAGMVASIMAGARPLGEVLSRTAIDSVHRGTVASRRVRADAVMFTTGVALLVATAIVVTAAPSLTLAGAPALAGVLVLVLPMLLKPLVRLGWALSDRPRGGLLMVSMSELEETPTRSAGLAATAAVAVFGIVAIEGARQDLARGLDRASYGLTHTSDVWVTPRQEPNTLGTVPFSAPGTARRLARTPGIADVRRYHSSFLDYRDRRVWVIAKPPADRFQIPPGQVLEGNHARAARLIRRGGWVAVTDAVARDQGTGVGERLSLPTPTGTRTFRLAARLTNVGWPAGTLIMNAHDYRRSWNTSEPAALEVDLDDGVTAAAGKRLVEGAISADAGLRVDTADERWSLLRDNVRQVLGQLQQISTLALISAILALAAAIGLAVWDRRPRLAELKLQGFSAAQVMVALLVEMAFVLGLGGLAGALAGLYGQALGTRWLELTTGFPAPYRPAGILALSILGLVSLVALLVAAVPGSIAARVPVRLAFRGG